MISYCPDRELVVLGRLATIEQCIECEAFHTIVIVVL